MSFSSSPKSPDRLWGPPVSYSVGMGGGYLSREKQPGHEADLSPASGPEVKERSNPLLTINALLAYTKTNVFTCTTFILDCRDTLHYFDCNLSLTDTYAAAFLSFALRHIHP